MKGVSMTEETVIPPGVDPAIPSPARIYDYVLGGTHNFASDRAAAERIREMTPDLADAAWVNRGFHQRAARWLAAERGIGQFIDIGSGLPTMGNTHTAVQKERRRPSATPRPRSPPPPSVPGSPATCTTWWRTTSACWWCRPTAPALRWTATRSGLA